MNKSIGVAFDQYIADDIAKYAGVTMPVKAGFFNRIMVTKALCTALHPNPDDEFSIPSVGPSYRIISEYEKKYIYNSNHSMNYFDGEEPIMVEKIRPDGYMILNGHHRWAAALKLGYKKIPIQVINVTRNEEIKDIIKNSKHDKRVTLDLDEVVFWNPNNGPAENDLPFPSLAASINKTILLRSDSALALRAPQNSSSEQFISQILFICIHGLSWDVKYCPNNRIAVPSSALLTTSAYRWDFPTPASPSRSKIGVFANLHIALLIN